jgi:hypothetical protein
MRTTCENLGGSSLLLFFKLLLLFYYEVTLLTPYKFAHLLPTPPNI